MVVNQQVARKELSVFKALEEYWLENNFGLLPHQIETAQKVIYDLDGRALLADEVGLGKTIEAGLILKEYILRGEVDRCLILTPASLGYQWWIELTNKFNIDLFRNRKGKGWHYFDHQIASIDLAKRKEHREIIYEQDFDMVIVDEAHKLKNKETLNWEFVNNLSPKYMLFLTATPIQNDLKELYNLVSLLKPEIFTSYKSFKSDFSAQSPDYEVLKDKLSQVMVRNERVDSEIEFTDRNVKLIPLKLTSPEQELYEGITKLVKEEYERCKAKNEGVFHLITLQREVCSSSFAVLDTLEGLLDSAPAKLQPEIKRLLKLAKGIEVNQKVQVVEELIREIDGQAVIFTEYLATQNYICNYLYNRGIIPVKFDGSLSDSQKEWAKRRFAQHGDVLVSTRAGSQGINLQFCNVIINYDLPWNPMKLEQRIGRVHRVGQANDVDIYNLSTQGTIEEKILNLLYEKIDLFQSVIGQLNNIVNDGNSQLEESILQSMVEDESELEEEFEKRIEADFLQKSF